MSHSYSPFGYNSFPFASESELNVEFSMEVLFCGPSGAKFSLIDSCDELSVYLWQEIKETIEKSQSIASKKNFFCLTNKKITSDKSSRS